MMTPTWLKQLIYPGIASLLIFLGYVLLATQPGLEASIWLLAKVLPGTLRITALQGCWLGPISLQTLHYQQAGHELAISKAYIAWNRLALFSQGRFIITQLELDTVNIKWPSHATQNKPSRLSILKHLRLVSGQVKQFNLQYGNTRLKLQGSVEQHWQLQWQLEIETLKDFLATVDGALLIKGSVQGERDNPRLQLALQSKKILFYDWPAHAPQARPRVNGKSSSTGQVTAQTSRIASIDHPKLSLQGLYLQLSGRLQPLRFQGQLNAFTLNYTGANHAVSRLTMPAIRLAARLSTLGLQATLIAQEPKAVDLNASVLLPHYHLKTPIGTGQSIQAQASLRLYQLDCLQPLAPWLTQLRGTLALDIGLNGSLASPHLQLGVKLQKAQAQLPHWGLKLRSIDASAQLNEKTLTWSGALKSGEGLLQFTGSSQLNAGSLFGLTTITGKNICIINTPTYQITANPRITLSTDTNYLKVNGEVLIPYARMNLNGHRKTAIELTKDVVFTDIPQPSNRWTLPIHSELRLRLGDNIQLRYQELQTNVWGTLQLSTAPNQPTMANGQLTLSSGYYYFHGQQLQVDKNSRLLFTESPIDNPKFDITLSKSLPVSKAGQVVATKFGVHIQGSKATKRVSLFADPPNGIDQTDILSYLLTDLPSRQLTQDKDQLLISALSSLSGVAGLHTLIYRLQKKLGLDQLNIQSDPFVDPKGILQENTALVFGKQLTPKFHVTYSKGLLSSVNILRASYIFNRHWSLEGTNSNLANGIDLRYKAEK